MTGLAYASPTEAIADYSNAIDYTNNLTVSLDSKRIEQRGGGNTLLVDLHKSAQNLSIRAGDSISGTVRFANGPIRLQGTSRRRTVYATLNFEHVPSPEPPILTSDDSLSLLGFAGTMPVGDPSRLAVISGEGLSVGLVESGSPYALSFTGFRYRIRVTGVFGGDGREEATVALASLRFQAETIMVGTGVTQFRTV